MRIVRVCFFIAIEFIGCDLRLLRCGGCSMWRQGMCLPALRYVFYTSFGPNDGCLEDGILSTCMGHLEVSE